jgi:hypothetical protein
VAKSPITDGHYAAFGKIILNFTNLDHLLDVAIAAALKMDPTFSPFFTAELRYEQKRNILATLNSVADWPPEVITEFESLLDETNSAARMRNRVAHSGWKAGRKPGHIKPMAPKAKGKLILLGRHHNEKEYSVADLEAEAAQIQDIARRFMGFLRRYGLRIPS